MKMKKIQQGVLMWLVCMTVCCVLTACTSKGNTSGTGGTISDTKVDRSVMAELGVQSSAKEHTILDEITAYNVEMAKTYVDVTKTSADREQAYQEFQQKSHSAVGETFTYYCIAPGTGTTREEAIENLKAFYEKMFSTVPAKATYCGMAEESVTVNGKEQYIISVALAW